MKAINYFKIDMRTIGNQKYIFLFYPLFILICFGKMGMISWMSLFTLPTMITLPFMLPEQYSCQKLNFTLPSSIESIVTGRFFYLAFSTAYTVILTYSGFFIFHTVESTQKTTRLFYLLGAAFIVILTSVEYVIFYKVGPMSKNLASMITILPAMVVALGFTYLGEKIETFTKIYHFLFTHQTMILVTSAGFSIIILLLCYNISIAICKHKDV